MDNIIAELNEINVEVEKGNEQDIKHRRGWNRNQVSFSNLINMKSG